MATLGISIVTDSCAHFSTPHFTQQVPITVVPFKVNIAGKMYREGVDISAEDALQLIAHQPTAPRVFPPSKNDYVEVFTRLARHSEAIISIHSSRKMYGSWDNGHAAAQGLMGHCEIAVIDSQTLSAGQAMLVRLAGRAIEQEATLDDVVRVVRGAVERIYSVYYVETMDYLLQNKLMDSSHAILGTMLGVKPFLTMEHGLLVPMEKVRTRPQAIERLVEFVIEFTEIEDAVIAQHTAHINEHTRTLQDRLAAEFPGRYFPHTIHGPSLAALIGHNATGLVILESPIEELDDDF